MTDDKAITQNSISISSVLQGNGGSTTSYLEQIITLKIVNVVEKMFKKFDKKSLAMLVLLLCANEGKQVLLQLLTSSKEQITEIITNLYYNRQQVLHETSFDLSDEPGSGLALAVNANLLFWKNIHKVILSEKELVTTSQSIVYDYIYTDFIYKSKNEYEFVKEFKNLVIQTETFKCKFLFPIKFKISCKNDIQNVISAEEYQEKLEVGKTFFDVLPLKDFKIHANKCIDECMIHQTRTDSINGINTSAFLRLFSKFNDRYKFSDPTRSFYELACIIEILGLYDGDSIFDMKIEEATPRFGTRMGGTGVYWSSTIAFKDYGGALKLWYQKTKETSAGKNTIVLESKNPSTLSDEDLFNEWINYTKTINDGCSEVETTKVNVYDIRIKEEKVVKEKEKEKEKSICDEKTDTSTLLLLNYINQSKEKEKEESEKTVKVIKSELMNQVYKSFDTLYLQKNDEFVLKSTLERFKDKRELFNTLGIPYKLGVLLHGEPGCGKSSVITAIASYLKRDIFYLDLSGVSTNEDLKNLFKYINTQENKNGIIVMEDIDTMCKIVLKRTETNTGISENGQLTLDCLLNLLQGTLTEDGLIFIATTNHLEKIDPAFYREGRFDVNINMKPCDEYQMQCIYKKFFNKQIPQEYLDKLKLKSITPAKFISNLLPFVLQPDNEDTEILKVFFEK